MSDPPPLLQYKSPTNRIITKERANACRSLRVLGGFCIALIAIAGLRIAGPDFGGTDISVTMAIYFCSIALFILGLGVTYWICAFKIMQFSSRAVIVAMVVTGIHVALVCLSILGAIQAGGLRGGIVTFVPLLFVPGLAQLMGYLAKIRREVI